MRVYELSKLLAVSNKELTGALINAGFEVGSHMSVVSEDGVVWAQKHFGDKDASGNANAQQPQAELQKKPVEEGPVIVLKPMPLGVLAEKVGVAPSQLILHLLRQGVVCNINQMLSVDQVKVLAQLSGFGVVAPPQKEKKEVATDIEEQTQERLPVVVVVGHVDHGKTTLLDYIRKTRVALREAGGITQHLGAYRVETAQGAMVFLDTPGHEAFVAMRKRGVGVADVVILLVAVDDGVMPQTLEALRQAKLAEVPIVVALNKVDLVDEKRVERVKTELSQHGLVPEEWGGETIMVPISAKTGKNVDTLLEMIALQAEMLELKTNLVVPAQGYVLESKMVRGRGAVATYVGKQGILSKGDFFTCGVTAGKVVSMTDCMGKHVSKALPSVPVSIAGFDQLPLAGDVLEVVSEEDYRKLKTSSSLQSWEAGMHVAHAEASEVTVSVIVKADTDSSKEAIVDSLQKLSKTASTRLKIIRASVGMVNESDVVLASSTGATIYCFGVKVEPGVAGLAKEGAVSLKNFTIIYKLLDDVKAALEAAREKKIIRKKIGSAIVRKVFTVKNLGTIAGVYIENGKVTRAATVEAFRNGASIGTGPIKSLQREKRNVKEITAGYEGAFIVPTIEDWQEDDVAEFYIEEIEA